MSLTKIQKFYKDQTVFITGGTGLFGTCLVEKLLRSCSDIRKIILLLRPKNYKTVEQRSKEYYENSLFFRIRDENPKLLEKISFVVGDMVLENFGLNEENLLMLTESVNIIFHCAASVRFDDPLKTAYRINVEATERMLHVAKKMPYLKAFVHVSTAFSHCIYPYTDETVQKPIIGAKVLKSLMEGLDDNTLSKITPVIMNKWPNTYTLTKFAAEEFVRDESNQLPIAMYRPPITGANYEEPRSGFIGTDQTLSLLYKGVMQGIVRVVFAPAEQQIHVMPLDFCINCMIAIAWDIGTNKNEEMLIYNHTTEENPTLNKSLTCKMLSSEYPLENIIWYPGLHIATSEYVLKTYQILFHILPSFLADLFLVMTGRKKRYGRIMKKVNYLIDITKYFVSTNFIIKTGNVTKLWKKLEPADQKVFKFDESVLDWDKFYQACSMSVKAWKNEDMEDFSKAIQKHKRMFMLHNFIKFSLISLFLLCIYISFSK